MIRIGTRHLTQAAKSLSGLEGKIPTAYMRALNHTGGKVKTAAGREIAARYTISVSDVKTHFTEHKASQTALVWELTAKGRPRSLIRFKVTPSTIPLRGKTIKAKVYKNSALKPLPGYFLVKTASGYFNVFKRSPGAKWRVSKTGRKGAYPIEARYGPGVSQMLANEEVTKALEEKAVQWLRQRFDHEMKRVFGISKSEG